MCAWIHSADIDQRPGIVVKYRRPGISVVNTDLHPGQITVGITGDPINGNAIAIDSNRYLLDDRRMGRVADIEKDNGFR